jgi:hypothetical protein
MKFLLALFGGYVMGYISGNRLFPVSDTFEHQRQTAKDDLSVISFDHITRRQNKEK